MSPSISETSPLIPKYEAEEGVEVRERSSLVAFCEILPAIVAVLLAGLDFGAAVTSYESIGDDFGQFYNANWVPVAYFLTSASALPVYHGAQSRYGWAKCLLLALILFTAGNVCAGISRSIEEAALGRALVGLGGGYMMSLGPSVVQTTAPMHLRGHYKAAFSATAALGCVVGAPLGGFLAKFATWRWTFICEAIVGYTLIILGSIGFYTCRPRSKRSTKAPLNIYKSFATFALLLSTAVLIDPALSLSSFWRPLPLLLLALTYVIRPISIDRLNISALLCAAILGAGSYHISLFQQAVFLKPAHIAGMWLTPAIVGSFVGSFFEGHILWASGLQFFGTIVALCHVGVVKKQLGGLVTGWVLTNLGSAGVLSRISQLSEDGTEPCSLQLSETRALGSFLGVTLGFTASKWMVWFRLHGEIPRYVGTGAQEGAYETAVIVVMACVVNLSWLLFGTSWMATTRRR